ncbi:unnamed protein product [Prunus armeniaca]
MEEYNLKLKLPTMNKDFQENEDGRKSLRFEGYGVYSLEGRKSLELCLVRLYREDDGFQGDETMAGVLATARKEQPKQEVGVLFQQLKERPNR